MLSIRAVSFNEAHGAKTHRAVSNCQYLWMALVIPCVDGIVVGTKVGTCPNAVAYQYCTMDNGQVRNGKYNLLLQPAQVCLTKSKSVMLIVCARASTYQG